MQSIPSAPLPRGDPRRRPATTSLTDEQLQEMIDDTRSTVEVKNHCQMELSRRHAQHGGGEKPLPEGGAADERKAEHIKKKQKTVGQTE